MSAPLAPPAPFPLRPVPERGGRCPRCAGSLRVVRLHVAGWRNLLQGSCPDCGRSYLQDLPSGHGLVYPATLDLDTGELHDPSGADWFSAPLRAYWERPDDAPAALEVERLRSVQGPALLLNCLDPVYGHALLKLMNAQGALKGEAACVALVPAALTPLVPPGVAEVWSVGGPVRRLGSYGLELEARLREELDRLGACALHPAAPHPHPSLYDLDELVSAVEPVRAGEPTVLLSLRDDRRWGRTRLEQRARVGALARGLRAAFPGVALVAVGTGDGPLPAAVRDERRAAPSRDDERRWIGLMKGADLAVGVHGSNLLLPSGLAAATIELTPRHRSEAIGQATLLREHDPLAALWTHRFVPGDDHLSDVSGAAVARIAVGMLAERERFATMMLGPVAHGAAPLVPLARGLAAHPPALVTAAARAGAARLRAQSTAAAARSAGARLRARRRARGLGPPPVVLEDRRGLRFELVNEEEIEHYVLHGGHFEGGEIELLAGALMPGDIALDVGANIGAFTAALARAVAPGGAVHAFEPHPRSRTRLQRTLELNGLTGSVSVCALAVAAEVEAVELVTYGPGYESWATTVPRRIDVPGGVLTPTATERLDSTTLDSYCQAHGIEHVGALKIDVEGGEPAVLAGAQGLLSSGAVDLLLVEVSDNTLPAATPAVGVLAGLEAHGLRLYVLEGGRLVAFRHAGRVEFANVVAATARGRRRLSRA